MKTHVEFRSESFPPYPGEEDEINPGVWGKRLAEFIYAGLKSRGFDAIDPASEDWGWMVEIRNDEFPLWVGCGNLDDEQNGLLCFIEPSTPFVRKSILWKVPTEEAVSKLQVTLNSILTGDPSISKIQWSSREEFGK